MPQDTASRKLQRKPRLLTAPRLAVLGFLAILFSACLIHQNRDMTLDLGNGYRIVTTNGNNPMIHDRRKPDIVIDETIDQIAWIDDILLGHTTDWQKTDRWFLLDMQTRTTDFFPSQQSLESAARERFKLTGPINYTSARKLAKLKTKPSP